MHPLGNYSTHHSANHSLTGCPQIGELIGDLIGPEQQLSTLSMEKADISHRDKTTSGEGILKDQLPLKRLQYRH